MTADSKESLLRRWSRRKLEAGEALAEEAEKPADTDAGTAAAPAGTEPEPVLTDADMPPLESLTDESDFSPFMSAGVSDELRNLALRKLFHASVFNIRDGLDEYDDDFTTFEKLGDIVTADMKHQIEMQQQKLREKLAAEGKPAEGETADREADASESFDGDPGEDIDDEAAADPRAEPAASDDEADIAANPPAAAGARQRAEAKS